MTEAEVRFLKRRQRELPDMLASARHKVAALENEARRYNMHQLLTDPQHVNRAWDEAIDQGRAACGYPDVVKTAK